MRTDSTATRNPSRKSFMIGWVAVTCVTLLVFAAFAGPMMRNGNVERLTQTLSVAVQHNA